MSSKLLPAEDRFKGKISTKFNFGWGSATDPADGAYSAPPDPLDGFWGPTSKGRKGRDGKEMGRRRGREEMRRGEGREEKRGGRRGKGKGKEGTRTSCSTKLFKP